MEKFNFTSSIRSAERFAAMLADEDIEVRFSAAEDTAWFDTKRRVLMVPLLRNDLSDDLYNMFVAHEVGHALFTPPEGWHNSIEDLGIDRDILNIVEDIRIEKLIREKYTGLYRTFTAARIELLELDFFGIKKKKIENIGFLNRLNVHSKSQGILNVPFKDHEKILVDKAMDVRTWEDVMTVSKMLNDIYKGGNISILNNLLAKNDDDDETISVTLNENDIYPEDADTSTDKNYRKVEIEYTRYDYDNAYITDNVRKTKMIIKSAKLDVDHAYESFIQRYNPILNKMVAQFNMRKNAANNAQSYEEKSGTLDPGRLHDYRFNDDLFARSVIEPKQKNHGIVMSFDTSGSMSGTRMMALMLKSAILCEFCRRIGIKFQLNTWATDAGTYMDSEMPFDRYKAAIANLYREDNIGNVGGTYLPNGLIYSMRSAFEMKERFRLDKVHMITMTDGGTVHSHGGVSLASNMQSLTASIGGKDYTAATREDSVSGYELLANIGRKYLGSQMFYAVDYEGQPEVTGVQKINPTREYNPQESKIWDHFFAITSYGLWDILNSESRYDDLAEMMKDFVDVVI